MGDVMGKSNTYDNELQEWGLGDFNREQSRLIQHV